MRFISKCVKNHSSITPILLLGKIAQGMGVIFDLVFMFSNFYLLDLHNKTYVSLANLQWNNCKKNWIKNWTLHDLVTIIDKCMFVDFLNWIHRTSQSCVTVECRGIDSIWKCNSISFTHASLWCLLLILTKPYTQSNIGVRLTRKKSHFKTHILYG